MDKVDELIIDVALTNNGRRDYYAGRNIAKEMQTIANAEEKIIKKNERLAQSQEKVAASGFKLGKALKTLGLYIGIREISKYADEWTQITSQLRILTNTESERVALQNKLFEISQNTRNATRETVDLYTKLTLNAQSLNLSQEKRLKLTELINKALVAGGGSAEDNKRVLLQFGQALGIGRFQGQDLKSILQSNIGFAKIIADGLGVDVGKLTEMGSRGELTSEKVINAILNQQKAIDAKYEKTSATLKQSLGMVSDSFMRLIGEGDEFLGITKKISVALEFLARNMKHVAYILGAVFLTRFAKTNKIIDLFLLNLKDGMGLLGSLKGVFLATAGSLSVFAKASWALVAPWVRLLAVFELVDQAIKMLKGEWNWYAEAIDKIERGTWWLANKVTGQNKPFQGTFSSDVKPMTPARTITNTYGGSQNITQNQNFNVTINEARDGSIAYDRLTQTLRQANAGIGGVR